MQNGDAYNDSHSIGKLGITMTLSSMTAFSRTAETTPLGVLVWETRSVNHRFLEISMRLPDALRYIEQDVRRAVQNVVTRGKIDLFLQYQPSATVDTLSVNTALVKQLSVIEQALAAHFSGVHSNLTDILRWPGVLEKGESQMEAVGESALKLLASALSDLSDTRLREGQALLHCLQSNVGALQLEVEKIERRMPEVLAHERQRVLDRIASLELAVDQDRLEQEMVWLAQKADIAEECQRLKTHIQEVKRVLDGGGVMGRRLDFLMQELNREANTTASKSLDVETTQSAVEMKVLIEQMREQVQNVE